MDKHPAEVGRGGSEQRREWGQPPRGVALPVLGMALLAAWAGVAGAAIAPPAKTGASGSHGFNFAYQSEGGRSAAPTQVFDDGIRTYMQFNALDRVPELWADDGTAHGAARRLAFHLESSYVVIDQVLPRVRLVIDGQESVLVNQAWKARSTPPRAATGHPTPRIWSDSTPFGPDEPPGPVAADRSARPSHDGEHPRAAPAAGQPRRVAIGQPEEGDDAGPALGDADAGASGVSADQAAQRLGEQPFATPDPLAEARLRDMQAQAMDMITRARQAGDAVLESRLRRIFRDIAQAPVAEAPAALPGTASRERGRQARWQHGPLLALADTRPRSDVSPQDESEIPGSGDGGSRNAPASAPVSAGAAARRSAGGALLTAPAGSPAGTATGSPSGTAGGGAPGTTAAGAASGQADATPRSEPLVFEVRDNQRLSQALGHFLETLGWRLEWESQSDFVVRRGYVVKAPTLRQVLLQTLGEYRLSAVLYSGNLVVAVTGGDR